MTSLYPLLTRGGMRGYRRWRFCKKGEHRDTVMQTSKLYTTATGHDVPPGALVMCCSDCGLFYLIGGVCKGGTNRTSRRGA